ncbi:MAG: DEAD/DEAH box helicase, partial [Paracoccaceae bacterium]
MTALSNRFETWLSSKNWRLHPHQLAMVDASSEAAQLLIAPTGAGKTLAGFLPSLIELENMHGNGLHTLYISPL